MSALIYLVLAVSAVVPSLLLMWYFHARDLFPEPARVLWSVFGLGVVIVFPILLVAWPTGLWIDGLAAPMAYGLGAAFLQAAIPEELFKFGVLWFFAARRAAFDEPMDGVVYGVAASLGFATLENVVYVTGGGAGVAFMRALTAVPSHAFLGAIMGGYVGRARFSGAQRSRHLRLALLVPIFLHGLYDFPLLAAVRVQAMEGSPTPLLVSLLGIAPLVVVVEWIWAVSLIRRLRSAQIRALPAEARQIGEARPGRLSSIALTLGGALVASLGGLVALGVALAWMLEQLPEQELGPVLAVEVLFGITPLAAGSAVFVWGVRRLNLAGRAD